MPTVQVGPFRSAKKILMHKLAAMDGSSPAIPAADLPGHHTVETREILVDGRHVTDASALGEHQRDAL